MKIAGFWKNSPHLLIRIFKKFETIELWSGSDTLSQPDFHVYGVGCQKILHAAKQKVAHIIYKLNLYPIFLLVMKNSPGFSHNKT